jgi:hypothetical protein
VVLTETACLFKRAGGVPAVLRFLRGLKILGCNLQPVLEADLDRTEEIILPIRKRNLMLLAVVSWQLLYGAKSENLAGQTYKFA